MADLTFSQRVKRLRQHLRMTQEELAVRLGVALTTVNRWEKGHFKPSSLAMAVIRRQEKQCGLDDLDLL